MKPPPHLLFHRPTIWASDVECSTKVLAKMLAGRGYPVSYLQSPLDPVHLLRRKGYYQVWKHSPRSDGNVRIVTPATLIPVRDIWPLDTPVASELRYRLTIPRLERAVRAPDRGAPRLIWTTVPGSAPPLHTAFPDAHIVFHVIDFYPAFRGDAVKRLEKRDYSVADEIYVIGDRLKEYLVADLGVRSDKIKTLGQGVDLKRFDGNPPEPEDLSKASHPRAIWAGVLAKGDPDLFRASAIEMKSRNGSLVLIGPTADWAVDLARQFAGTVHLLGPKPPADLPAFLKNSDLGLMLYNRGRQAVYRGQNPLKLYEYAAAGLPIISTPHDEFTLLRPPVLEVRAESDITPAISSALSDPDRMKRLSLEFARLHSWQAKVSEIESHTLSKLGQSVCR